MSLEENKAFVREAMDEIWNKHNLAAVDKAFAQGFVGHDPSSAKPQTFGDRKDNIATYQKAFPDVQCTIDDLVAEGDKVAFRWTAPGTHQGEFQGLPATNKVLTLTGTTIFRIAGGKIAESWESYDALGMLQQAGVVPPPPGA